MTLSFLFSALNNFFRRIFYRKMILLTLSRYKRRKNVVQLSIGEWKFPLKKGGARRAGVVLRSIEKKCPS